MRARILARIAPTGHGGDVAVVGVTPMRHIVRRVSAHLVRGRTKDLSRGPGISGASTPSRAVAWITSLSEPAPLSGSPTSSPARLSANMPSSSTPIRSSSTPSSRSGSILLEEGVDEGWNHAVAETLEHQGSMLPNRLAAV